MRTLGSLTTSDIGYGAMALVPGMYGDSDDRQALATVRHAVTAGATLLDTADAYGAGENERLVGRAIAGRRDEVQLATKWGIVFDGGRTLTHHHAQEIRVDARPERARDALEASLRRLGVDHVDLWYLHFPDPGVPLEETVGAMAELVAEGKARHLGLCNVTAEQVLATHQLHPLAAVQSEYSLWTRDPERALLPVLSELGVGFVPWSPLGAGFFAGDVRTADQDFRANHPRFAGANLAANRDRFARLRDLADELDITPAQLALAWLLHRGEHLVPIPSTRTPAHLDENLRATDITLDAAALARIDALAPAGAASGSALL
ncbi:aryl-alcohol dehydrogenase-like predicted oxidoreductase [Solirubrobacter pauli]|uniref:Aryl-alcohol dehydrogenase-like predicted oxidoreductase n=1 Tax=Solirubrobacter pauli TaxID=166793 RepID=A0A660L0P1_9ACTN|nr:aldo/keto reductase [Solirubrobacter pauli]RKQ87426.1 aryl-alcohol dehydrogenase-like predicted oxidoreductase [Solirubrobacter pauli]